MLLDTNVLVYALDQLAEQHDACFQVLQAAVKRQIQAFLVPQVLLECYSVVTSPQRGRQLLQPSEILAEIHAWRSRIPMLEVRAEAMDELARLITATRRTGPRVYDLFLVAQMRTHRVREICTVNLRDFRIPGIRAYLPEQTLARYGRA
ncbi:MAG TPA: type II toxin-antitoxin system VapC family toxin [Chloroflexota bacterium]|nr:type II toxin-antitoxin system VapC family toxin [Chloroflexota bacterium]